MQMSDKDALTTKAADLSGGMKRKLSIAIAFMGKPEVALMRQGKQIN